MSVPLQTQPGTPDRAWYIVGRWSEFEGEGRANLMRIIGILAFYAVEQANYRGLKLGLLAIPKIEPVDRPFHLAMTALAAAWVLAALGVHICLRVQIFPTSLKYVSTGIDLLLMTCVLALANSVQSPLIVGYFLIVAMAGLRFNLPLLWYATIGGMLSYLVLPGQSRWFSPGDLRVPRYHQVIFLLALGLTGATIGQILRRVRSMAVEYAGRLEAEMKRGLR